MAPIPPTPSRTACFRRRQESCPRARAPAPSTSPVTGCEKKKEEREEARPATPGLSPKVFTSPSADAIPSRGAQRAHARRSLRQAGFFALCTGRRRGRGQQQQQQQRSTQCFQASTVRLRQPHVCSDSWESPRVAQITLGCQTLRRELTWSSLLLPGQGSRPWPRRPRFRGPWRRGHCSTLSRLRFPSGRSPLEAHGTDWGPDSAEGKSRPSRRPSPPAADPGTPPALAVSPHLPGGCGATRQIGGHHRGAHDELGAPYPGV